MTLNPFSEDHLVEQPALELLAELEWQTASGLEETFAEGGGSLGRRSRSEVLLLLRPLQELTPWVLLTALVILLWTSPGPASSDVMPAVGDEVQNTFHTAQKPMLPIVEICVEIGVAGGGRPPRSAGAGRQRGAIDQIMAEAPPSAGGCCRWQTSAVPH
jgi:hypothetical protein